MHGWALRVNVLGVVLAGEYIIYCLRMLALRGSTLIYLNLTISLSCSYPNSSSSAGKINAIEFENVGIQGTIPDEIEQLESMRWFSSERGELTGPIPSTIGNLQSLLLLDMDFNELSGPLPDSMWSLTQLRQLDLNDNELSGTLSESIGDLSELRFFQIDNNGLSGTIPDGLGDAVNFGELLFTILEHLFMI